MLAAAAIEALNIMEEDPGIDCLASFFSLHFHLSGAFIYLNCIEIIIVYKLLLHVCMYCMFLDEAVLISYDRNHPSIFIGFADIFTVLREKCKHVYKALQG